MTSCFEVASRNTPPVTNACGALYCRIGKTPQTGRAESCKAGVSVVVAEKTRSADSAAAALPHHSTRDRPLAGTRTCFVDFPGSSSTKPWPCKLTLTFNSLAVLLLTIADIKT